MRQGTWGTFSKEGELEIDALKKFFFFSFAFFFFLFGFSFSLFMFLPFSFRLY